jgi:hypothetical protein
MNKRILVLHGPVKMSAVLVLESLKNLASQMTTPIIIKDIEMDEIVETVEKTYWFGLVKLSSVKTTGRNYFLIVDDTVPITDEQKKEWNKLIDAFMEGWYTVAKHIRNRKWQDS